MKTVILQFTVLCLIASGTAQERPEGQPCADYVAPQDVYPMGDGIALSRLDVKVESMVNERTVISAPFAVYPSFFNSRTSDDCAYPLEVVIVQDISDSIHNDMPAMINTQLPAMYKALTTSHPGTTFGAVSFIDKPIEPFGWPHQDGYRDDWCYKLEGPLGLDLEGLQSIYRNYVLGGGYDFPENQYGVLINTVQSQKIGWGSNPSATRLIVLSTDSPPHYDDDNAPDSSRHGMTKYSGIFDEDDIDGQCVSEYYPSWQQAITQLTVPSDGTIGPYIAFILWDESDNQQTTKTYQWFASQIAENDSFVGSRGQNSSMFWRSLSSIIDVIDSLECSHEPLTTTTHRPTTGNESCICNCASGEECECARCNVVVVKPPCDSKEVHLDVKYH